MFEYLRLERQKELEPLRARRIKNLNHEAHEGHEEKGNEVFIFINVFDFNHTTHEEGFHHEVRRERKD